MNAIADAATALKTAVDAVDGIVATIADGASVTRTTAIVGPPALTFEAYCPEPTSARFLVAVVVVPADERALARLWELVPAVAAAIEGVTDASVIRADPGNWRDLPSYEIQVEVSLQ